MPNVLYSVSQLHVPITVDILKQKLLGRYFSYNYIGLFIESILSDRQGIHRVMQLAGVNCI